MLTLLKWVRIQGESIGSIQVDVKESAYHIELNLAELRGYEKNVIVKLIKERHTKCNKSTYAGHGSCKGIITLHYKLFYLSCQLLILLLS